MNAKLHIQVRVKDGRSRLQSSYATPPFKLANITEPAGDQWLHLVVMSSSPGILDGDNLEVQVILEEGSKLHLHTQSYQRLFQMQTGACQAISMELKQGSSCIYLPHPAAPHAGSIFSSRNSILLHEDCRLIWGEVITCGRHVNERFTFSKYHSVTECFIGKKLAFKENLLMQPTLAEVQSMGLLEGYTHQATLICIDDFEDIEGMMNAVHAQLSVFPNMLFGVSKAPVKGFTVRILGFKAEQLFSCLQQVAARLEKMSVNIDK